jgi:hypothetical protein
LSRASRSSELTASRDDIKGGGCVIDGIVVADDDGVDVVVAGNDFPLSCLLFWPETFTPLWEEATATATAAVA